MERQPPSQVRIQADKHPKLLMETRTPTGMVELALTLRANKVLGGELILADSTVLVK